VGFRLENTAEGVKLDWDGPAGDFRVFRKTGDEQAFARLGDTQQQSYVDRSSEFGKSYTYLVQRVVKLAGNKEAESDPSSEIEITPKDTFPPLAPTGLRAPAAPASIELSWERNTETDLAGYRIYRSTDNGPFEKIADVGQIPSYSDRGVQRGKQYRYQIAAFDQSGNESPRSAPVEATIP
jgi:fibronectin type 3 domain-containing protein